MGSGFQISQKKSVQSVKSAVEKIIFWHIFKILIQRNTLFSVTILPERGMMSQRPSVPAPEQYNLMGVHTSELMLKGKNRYFFEKILLRNLRHALSAIGKRRINQQLGKFFIPLSSDDATDTLVDMMRRIPGVETFFFARHLPHDMELLKDFLVRLSETYVHVPFAVRCRRPYKSYPINSMEINKILGALLVDRGWTVNLSEPEMIFRVEILQDGFLVYTTIHRGPGGIPLGVSGKVVALLSGGIDSPVAARLLYNRGCRVIYAHFHNQTADSCGVRDKIQQIVRELQKYQPPTRLYMIPFEALQKSIIMFCPPRQRMIVYRRVMFRIARMIAKKEGALGFVTGDSIGQVASQTLENLRTIYAESTLPIFTPLIGMNKQETVDLARKFGTYDISIMPYDDCCSFMIAKHPDTRSNVEKINVIEADVPLRELEAEAFASAEVLTI